MRLLHSLHRGDDAGDELAEVFDRVGRAVQRVCPKWLQDRREDIVQSAMLRVVRILSQRGEGEGALPASYLHRVAYSATIDEIRRLRVRPQADDTEPDEAVASPTGDPEGEMWGTQVGGALRECLERLVDARRRAVTLYLLGHSVPEAASMMRWTAKKTENLVYRGLSNLRQCLASKGVQP